MLLLGIITLVMTIPLASLYLSTILIHRIAFLILLLSAVLSYNTLYVVPLSSGIGILGGLFQTTLLSQSLEIFILIIGSLILLIAPEGKNINTRSSSFNKENIKDPNKTTTLWSYWDNLSSNIKEVLPTTTSNKEQLKDYPLIILFTTLGMTSLISSSDLITMFLAIELQSFALYILATMNRNSESAVAAGLKYFLLGGLSSCFILLGSITGLAQYKIKRLLAYSTISHVGLILLALGNESINGLESTIFYIVQYSITSLNIFLILILLGYTLSVNKTISVYSPIQFISQLRGQFFNNPTLSIALALSLFSMSGIPPLIGFFGKYFVINSALMNGNYFLSLVVIITSVISTVYYLQIVKTLFLPENSSAELDNNSSLIRNNNLSPILAFIVAILTLFIIFFMINPTPILNSIHLIATCQYYF